MLRLSCLIEETLVNSENVMIQVDDKSWRSRWVALTLTLRFHRPRGNQTCLALAAKLNALRLVINSSMVQLTFHYLEPFSHNYLCEVSILKCEIASLVCIVVDHLVGRLIAKGNVSPCSGNG